MDERLRQSVTVSAKTVDEAIAEAERELGVPRERLDITVITEGSKGFLGMRAENARILAMVVGGAPAATTGQPRTDTTTSRAETIAEPTPMIDNTTTRGSAPPVVDVAGEETFEPADEYDDEVPLDQSASPGNRAQQNQETAALAQEILETLLHGMDLRARVSVRALADPIVLDIETDNGGLLIGRRGETLSALQYLVNVLIGKRTRRWTKVVIDVEHWRDRRAETLRALALRQADRVRQQRRSIALDPMPANERRIVHLTLQDQRDIETHSEGEEPNRRLVISLKR